MAGLYIHIPFCKSRCIYCGFYSTTGLALREAYTDAICQELAMRGSAEPVGTIYLGGGTPSQLSIQQLHRIFDAQYKYNKVSAAAEVTIECNPDDVTPEFAKGISGLPVNRVSMGVQSFEDHILELIGRRHNAAQVTAAINSLRENGINNISIDLIYGLPGQTVDSWTRSVEQAVALKPQHISAYGLTYEEGTKLWHQRERGEVIEVPEEQCLMMYRILVDHLRQAGFDHYEISNFALPGYYSRHNSSYWNDTPYLGLGAAAHSYDGRVRRSNPCDLLGYVDKVMSGEAACEVEELTTGERYDERVMLGLRTSSGVDAARLREDFGDEALRHFMREAQPHIDAGHLRRAGDRYVLTGDGIMLSDSVMRDLLWDE